MNKKTLIILIVILFAFSTFMGILSAEDVKIPKKALKLEKKADKATKKKEYDKAMELYKQALEIHQDMETVHYKIAYLFALKNNYKEAINELYTTLKINKDNENAKKLLINLSIKYSNSLLKQRKIEEANKFYIKISSLEGINDLDAKYAVEIKYWIGFTYFQLQKPEKANEYLQKFITSVDVKVNFPKLFSTANYLLGLNYTQANDIDNSNKYLSAFIEINKEDKQNIYLGIAKYLIAKNNFNILKEKIRNIEKVRTRANLKESDKKILALTNSCKDIEDNLLFAIEIKPDLEDAYVLLGNFYYLKKNLDNSIKYYKLLVEKFSSSPDVEIYKVFLKDIERQKKQK